MDQHGDGRRLCSATNFVELACRGAAEWQARQELLQVGRLASRQANTAAQVLVADSGPCGLTHQLSHTMPPAVAKANATGCQLK